MQGDLADPFDDGFLVFKIQYAGGVLIQTQNGNIFRQQGNQLPETRLTHETKAGVMRAALGIVPMRYHHKVETEIFQNIHPICPV